MRFLWKTCDNLVGTLMLKYKYTQQIKGFGRIGVGRVLRALGCGRISNPRWCKRDERLLLFEKLNNTKVMATQASQNNTFGWREGSKTAQRKLFGVDGAKGCGLRGTPCAFPV